MPLYLFKKQNGQYIQLLYSINNCPKQIILWDGTIAKKQLTVPYLLGTPQTKYKIKQQQTKKNIDAGNRGRSYWTKKIQENK